MRKTMKIIFLLVIGVALGISGTILVSQQIAKQHVPYNEVVVQPTRKATVRYTDSKGSMTFPNPQKKLVVVVYKWYQNTKTYAYTLYELKTPENK